MSVFNEVKYIDKSINSILSQSYQDFELLIIDDFSNDGTLKKLEKYSLKDKRIRLFYNKKRKGLARNLNFLIYKSKYDYLARADADDFYDKKRLELQKLFLDKNKNIDILGTDGYKIDINSNIVGEIIKSKHNNYIDKIIYFQNPLIHSSIMMRKNELKSSRFNFYDQKFKRMQDYELWIRKFNGYNIHSLSSHLTFYRIKNQNDLNYLLKDLYYGNLLRFKRISNLKKLLFSLFLFNLQKIKMFIKSLFFK